VETGGNSRRGCQIGWRLVARAGTFEDSRRHGASDQRRIAVSPRQNGQGWEPGKSWELGSEERAARDVGSGAGFIPELGGVRR